MTCLCSREIKIRIISIICIVLTSLSALNLVKIVVTGDVGIDLPLLYNGSYNMALYVQSSVILVHLLTYILLLLGSLYNIKVMLIPSMFITSLQIIIIILLAIYFIYLGTFVSWLMLIPVFIVLGWIMYILVVVIQFYRELLLKEMITSQPVMVLSNHTYHNNNDHQRSFQVERKHPPTTLNSNRSFQYQHTPYMSSNENERRMPLPGQYLSLNNDFWEWKQRGQSNV